MFQPSNPIRYKSLDPRAIKPVQATAGAAAFDLFAIEHEVISAGHPGVMRTGLAIEVPPGFVMLINSRSGHGFNHDVRLANCQGWIDSDYRGEVKVKLTADGRSSLRIKPGDRIAQFLLVAVLPIALVEATDLTETGRGAGGFGSTGS